MKTRYLKTLAFVALCTLSLQLFAQSGAYQIQLKTGVVEMNGDFQQALAVSQAQPGEQELYRYVHFDPLPSDAVRARLESRGIRFLSYLPEGNYILEIPRSYNLASLQQAGARSMARIRAVEKIHPNLLGGAVPDHAVTAGGGAMVRLLYHPGKLEEMQRWFFQRGLTFSLEQEAVETGWVEVHISPVGNIPIVAGNPYVRFIEPIPPAPTPDDDEARGLHRSNAIDTHYPSGRHYTGEGVSMAIADDGAVGPHIDVKGRVDQTGAAGPGGSHGDMTVGIAMGGGNLNPRYRGHATDAFMYVYDISGYPHIIAGATNLITRGVHVTSTSYSQGCNEYTSDTQFGDQQIRQNPTLIHVFSAGNSSSSNCGYGATGYGNITGGYKQGKNVIATANLNSSDVRTTSSSRGPAEDGRIKPDISANGTDQMSIAANNNYQVGGGTSAASPSIAGTLAQLIEAYRDLNGGTTPETSLLKGTIMNTAEDLGNPGPDFEHGWGRINALRAFRLLEEDRYFSGSLSTGGSNTHSISVPAGLQQVRVMVYWHDWEGDPLAAKALVNDLDIQLQAPGGTIYDPWVLDHTPLVSALSAPATRGPDALNNMEQVSLLSPAAGNYVLTVDGTTVPFGPQKYWVTVEFIGPEVEVTYPIGGEGFVPGELEKIRWDAFGNTGTFNLEYSTNGGSTWTTINSAVSSTARYYDWTVPSVISGDVRVRVTRGPETDMSDADFSIITVPANLTVDGACPTSVDLSWDPVAGATSYVVRMLGAEHMDSVGSTTGTTMTVMGTNPIDEFWFSVEARGPSGLAGRRTLAVAKAAGIYNCIVAEDLAMQNTTPSGSFLFDCFDYSDVPVSVTVENTGMNTAANYTVAYRLNGGSPTVAAFTNLAAGATLDYTFSGTLDLSAPGTYVLETWVSYGPDENRYNDTIRSELTTVASSAVSLFSQNLETFAACGTTSNCEAEVCALGGGWINATNTVSDDIDWRTDTGGTPSSGTGPTTDHDPGTSTGNYLYLEASSGCEGQQADLLSPCIDLSSAGNPVLTFWYHMFGTNVGELHLDIFDGGSWTEDITPAISGDQGNLWIERSVNLSAFVGQTVVLRWRGITGNGFSSDIALDDIDLFDLSLPPVTDFVRRRHGGMRGRHRPFHGPVDQRARYLVLDLQPADGDLPRRDLGFFPESGRVLQRGRGLYGEPDGRQRRRRRHGNQDRLHHDQQRAAIAHRGRPGNLRSLRYGQRLRVDHMSAKQRLDQRTERR